MRPAPMRKMVRPVTMGGKHRFSMRGGMKESSTASQQQVICNHKNSLSYDDGLRDSMCLLAADKHSFMG